jgi:hypothetical protein
MPARVAIRRLELRGLAPRDHPAPRDLEQRLIGAARSFLPEALEQAVAEWSGEAVLRIRRLEVDVTLDAAFEQRAFAAFLARAIVRELRNAEERGSSDGGGDGVVCYPSRAIYLAALLEALAEGRAAERWWLGDAEGLRFLSPAQALRTALLADARCGLEALASLPPLRRTAVLSVLTALEADRILDGFARGGPAAGPDACVRAVLQAAEELPAGGSALSLFVAAFARDPALAGEALAAAVRLWVETEQRQRAGPAGGAASDLDEREADALRTSPGPNARRILAAADERSRPAASEPLYRFTAFGGLLLLLPDLGGSDIANVVATWPGAPSDAAVIAYAALGLCAGRERFADYMSDGLWRELFGLDPRASTAAITSPLSGISDDAWSVFDPHLAPPNHLRDARFLLPQCGLVGSRAARRSLAGLARAASKRFARRLPGFGEASAPFLWANLLAMSAALERRPGGWSARLSRPPLDVLLSLARAAQGSVQTPSGVRIDIARTSP